MIESGDNPLVKRLRRLQSGRGIRKYGSAVVSGPRLVEEFLSRAPQRCEAWIDTAKHAPPPDGLPAGVAWYRLSGQLFREIDVVGTNAPLLLVRVPELPKWDPGEGLESGCTLLVPFQDPENVGTVIRSAAAFGVERVVLLAECAHPYHPRALRASAGAVLGVDLFEGPSLDELPDNTALVTLSPEGRDIAGFRFPEAFMLLPGIEGAGLPPRLRERALSIPVSDAVESLNSATATAITLYLWRQATS
jgi:tRNA G18 (ribose-2'-O)-methylase SpoU